ncbi:MAG: alpha/beta fold hydrolase [Solirubrobacteraceae bacterium]
MAELDAGTGEELAVEVVASIEMPVLLLEGALSQKVFRNSSTRLARRLPHAHVQVLPGASHMMQFDAPTDYERAVLSVAG